MKTDILIVGAGAAGLAAAFEARRRAPSAAIALVDARESNIYRPWLIHRPTGKLHLADLEIPLSTVAERLGAEFRQSRVEHLDPVAGLAQTPNGQISFTHVLVTAGAPADTTRIPGSAEHAMFPCDVEQAEHFTQAVQALPRGAAVTIIVSGARIGPGLEYAAYLGVHAGAEKTIKVRVIADGDALAQRFGPKPARRVADILATKGVETLSGRTVTAVQANGVALEGGDVLPSALTAVVGPLRGAPLRLSAEFCDELDFLRVGDDLRSVGNPRLFAAGDAICRPELGWLPTWRLALATGRVAGRNLAAALKGEPLTTFSLEQGRKLSRANLPDLGGTGILASAGKTRATGGWLLVLRRRADRAHFATYAPGDQRMTRLVK